MNEWKVVSLYPDDITVIEEHLNYLEEEGYAIFKIAYYGENRSRIHIFAVKGDANVPSDFSPQGQSEQDSSFVDRTDDKGNPIPHEEPLTN